MFREKLTRVINNIDGALGCILIGFDGIPIDSAYKEGGELPHISTVAVELSNLLDKFRRLQLDDIGDVNEVAIRTGNVVSLARVVGGEYLLILSIDSEADVGRGQTMLRLVAPYVEKEI